MGYSSREPDANSVEDNLEPKTILVMKKSIGLATSMSILIGSMTGSGIFVSPNGILSRIPSFGGSLVIWAACGIYSLLGAYCYAELACMMPRSGADYSYYLEAFGPLAAFLRLWIEIIVGRPTGVAVIAMVFAQYTVHPFFPDCKHPEFAITMLALCCILITGFINCVSIRLTTWAQDIFTVGKVLALLLIVITGFVEIGKGHTELLQNPFENSDWHPSKISGAFYTGLFSYAGWTSLNNMVEEMSNPHRDFPLAVIFACLLVTIIYLLTNVAYGTVLTVGQIVNSQAVAVSFATRVYGSFWWIMPICVAFSTFGTVNVSILTTSRLFFVAAKERQMPAVLSMLHPKLLTPIPSVILTCLISIVYLFIGDVNSLIAYLGFVQTLATGIAVLIVVIFRYKRRDLPRAVRVPIAFAYIFLAGTLFLSIFAFTDSPIQSLMGLLITASGIPVYWICFVWKHKPIVMHRCTRDFTVTVQKVFRVVPTS